MRRTPAAAHAEPATTFRIDAMPAWQRFGIMLLNFAAFAALCAVLSYWGWRWFGPSPVHIPHAEIDDVPSALAVSPPFGAPRGETAAPQASARSGLAQRMRLLGVLAEEHGRGHALFRMADGSARLVEAGAELDAATKLVAVRPEGVTVRDADGDRTIPLRAAPPAGAPAAAAPAPPRLAACAIPQGYQGPIVRLNAELVQGLISQPETLRAIGDVRDGALVVREESGFAAMLGMKKGDRVTQANGIALRSPEDIIVAVLRPLAANQVVRIVGQRGSEPRELVLVNASACRA
jgi:hypothetical protein